GPSLIIGAVQVARNILLYPSSQISGMLLLIPAIPTYAVYQAILRSRGRQPPAGAAACRGSRPPGRRLSHRTKELGAKVAALQPVHTPGHPETPARRLDGEGDTAIPPTPRPGVDQHQAGPPSAEEQSYGHCDFETGHDGLRTFPAAAPSRRGSCYRRPGPG